jgi:hypothetical protein
MPQLVVLFLVIAGVLAAGTGLVRWDEGPGSLAWLALGAVSVAVAYVGDRGRLERKRRREQMAEEAAARQRDDFLARWQPGQVLTVRRFAGSLPGAVLVAALGAAMLWLGLPFERRDVVFLVLAAVLLGGGLLALARLLPAVGHPALELSAAGVMLPLNGRIAWRDIAGIHLMMATSRGGRPVSFRLLFRVADVERAVQHVHWTDRLFGMLRLGALGKGIVTSGACAIGEDPGRVEALAQRLWMEATGHCYLWRPGMSDAALASLQRQAEIMARLSDPAAVDATPEGLARMRLDLDELDRAMASALPDSPRASAKLAWCSVIIVLCTLFYFAWVLLEA